jgi:N-methylhydantoinase A/oxoprolinase/acetone carboxylase beta subunit
VSPSVTSGLRLGIDVGGTFTDLVALDAATGETRTEKVLTTPADPAVGALEGVRRLEANGLDPASVAGVIHGTTLVTNALIERRGAKAGLLTTRGFRDVLYFGNEYRYDVYDPHIRFPEPLVPRRLRLEVDERLDGSGSVIEALDHEGARRAIRRLLEEGVESVAVCLLHAYLNPEHERALGRLIAEEAGNLPVSLSHEVLPQIREFPRMSATVINAYTQPLVRDYLERLRAGLLEQGFSAELLLMTSAGGTITVGTAARFPIQLVESGPAAGSLIAGFLSSQLGDRTSLSFDMGGTTAKACVLRDGRPLVTKSFEVARVRRFKKGSGMPVGVPVIDMIEIGAGGGSIAEIDEFGLLTVGPRSAGSSPGPVCYGLGGTEPTVTDAALVLGFLDPEYFLGGEMRLDAERATAAIEEKVGGPLGLSAVEAAAAINRVVTENMTEAARVHSVEANVDLRRSLLIAFGGAGPIHAFGLVERLRLAGVVCPPDAGVLSALGLLAAPLSFEFARTYSEELDLLDSAVVNGILESLEQQGRKLLHEAGIDEIAFERSVDMCYSGQGFEVTTPIAATRFAPGELPALQRAFDDVYAAAYGRRLEGFRARCVTWRVLASGPRPPLTWKSGAPSAAEAASKEGRRAYFPESGWAECAVYERSRLGAGASFRGPALIEDTASTIVVPPGVNAAVDARLNVRLSREPLDSPSPADPSRPMSLETTTAGGGA